MRKYKSITSDEIKSLREVNVNLNQRICDKNTLLQQQAAQIQVLNEQLQQQQQQLSLANVTSKTESSNSTNSVNQATQTKSIQGISQDTQTIEHHIPVPINVSSASACSNTVIGKILFES